MNSLTWNKAAPYVLRLHLCCKSFSQMLLAHSVWSSNGLRQRPRALSFVSDLDFRYYWTPNSHHCWLLAMLAGSDGSWSHHLKGCRLPTLVLSGWDAISWIWTVHKCSKDFFNKSKTSWLVDCAINRLRNYWALYIKWSCNLLRCSSTHFGI